jgi:hypothetical protein
VLEVIRDSYRHATLALELPFSGGFGVFPVVQQIPLVARRPTKRRDATRAHFGLPAGGRVVLLSFGGYGLPALDLAAVDIRGDWTIVTIDRVSPDAARLPHVRSIVERDFLTSDFRYEDLIASVDAVMTKPGYGIISECITAGTPMVYTSRGVFREYDVFVEALPRYLRSQFISHADLFAGRWHDALQAVLSQPLPPDRLAPDGAERAAEEILAVLDAGR